jgi:predicted DNA-binding protein
MLSQSISVRIPGSLGRRLTQLSLLKGIPQSEIVREALEAYLAKCGEERSTYSLLEEAGLIGCAQRTPRDLSTNKMQN